ncbi:site-specific integrase [Halodesulfovibrio aestuarii]|uniref:tyrosine-type recombinase/integrase n=1 Tax=Halodesulfovibrio aestuarii TaxID=126333 RepID=UPI00041CF8A0
MKKIFSGIPCVYYSEHPTRKYGRYPDRYIILRYRRHGKVTEQCLGWTSNGRTLAEAERLVKIFQQNIKNGEGPTTLKELREQKKRKREEEAQKRVREKQMLQAQNIMFKDGAKKFLEWAKSNTKSTTYQNYNTKLHTYVIPNIGTRLLNDIKTQDIINFKTMLLNQKKKKKRKTDPIDTLYPSSVREILATTREVFNYCAETPISEFDDTCMFTGDNPFIGKKFRGKKILPKASSGNKRTLTENEVNLLLGKTLWNENLHDATMIAIHTGMRIGEICSLRQQDLIDFKRCVIHIFDAKTGSRSIVFPSDLSGIIKKRASRSEKWVFPNQDGSNHIAQGTISSSFRKIVDQLGLNDNINDNRLRVTFHTLHSVYAVRMLTGGMTLETLRLQLGHADIQTTIKNYVPLTETFNLSQVEAANAKSKIKPSSDDDCSH